MEWGRDGEKKDGFEAYAEEEGEVKPASFYAHFPNSCDRMPLLFLHKNYKGRDAYKDSFQGQSLESISSGDALPSPVGGRCMF